MSFWKYFNEKLPFIVVNLVIFSMINLMMFAARFKFIIFMLFFLVWFAPLLTYIIFEYFKIKKYLDILQETTDELDKKYLIAEVIDEPNFLEGQIIHDIFRDCNKSMAENVRDYRINLEEYKEYIDTWVHEIKTPIASAKLIIENNKNDDTGKINEELDRVDNFIEQVLYYSKSSDVSKDYIIRDVILKDVVFKCVKSKSKDFINKRISLKLEELDLNITTDEKWIVFILNQIVQNSIKYSKDSDAFVKISAEATKNKIKLIIEDNGVGITERDLSRVFEKGFTGENGRIFGKSTGMGLYICKKLCDRLHIGLSINSKVGNGTTVVLALPRGGSTVFE